MRTMLSALALCVWFSLLPVPAHAGFYSYVIDLSFPFEPTPDSDLAISGSYQAAGRFDIDMSLLPDDAITFVPYSRFENFSLSLPVLSLAQQDLSGGTCLTASFPLCGMLFLGSAPQTLVGHFVIPSVDGRFSFHLANTSGGFPSPDPLFQSVRIDDLDPRFRVAVASGFVTAVRPVPEPSSLLLLTVGGLIAGRSIRRSRMRSIAPAA